MIYLRYFQYNLHLLYHKHLFSDILAKSNSDDTSMCTKITALQNKLPSFIGQGTKANCKVNKLYVSIESGDMNTKMFSSKIRVKIGT